MNISIPANNSITRSVDSCSWLVGTISRPYGNTIKSKRLPSTKLEFKQFSN